MNVKVGSLALCLAIYDKHRGQRPRTTDELAGLLIGAAPKTVGLTKVQDAILISVENANLTKVSEFCEGFEATEDFPLQSSAAGVAVHGARVSHSTLERAFADVLGISQPKARGGAGTFTIGLSRDHFWDPVAVFLT